MGVAVVEKEDQDKGGWEGEEGVRVLAKKEAGYGYHCLESGLSFSHTPNADSADPNLATLIH